MSASTVVGANMERNKSITMPLVLNEDLEATMDIRIAKISLAIRLKTLYLEEFPFHHSKISKFSSCAIR